MATRARSPRQTSKGPSATEQVFSPEDIKLEFDNYLVLIQAALDGQGIALDGQGIALGGG